MSETVSSNWQAQLKAWADKLGVDPGSHAAYRGNLVWNCPELPKVGGRLLSTNYRMGLQVGQPVRLLSEDGASPLFPIGPEALALLAEAGCRLNGDFGSPDYVGPELEKALRQRADHVLETLRAAAEITKEMPAIEVGPGCGPGVIGGSEQ